MKFPASDEEKQLVHLSCRTLDKSLADAVNLMNALENLLKENHIAIDKEYRKIIFDKIGQICSCEWRIKLQAFHMNEFKERVISPP